MVRWQLGIAVASILILCGATATSQQVRSVPSVVVVTRTAITKDGWWMRVNTDRTRATRIDWQLRTLDGAPAVRTWWFHSGHPAEVWVETPLRHENALRVQAVTTPADAPGSICVFWRRQGVALMEFTGTAERQLDATQTELACVP